MVDRSTPQTLTLAVTGASGAILARTMLALLEADPRVAHVDLVLTDSALRVQAEELNLPGRANLVERLLGKASEKVQLHTDANIGASIASGSYPSAAMVVLPCSMGTLAAISAGLASSLVHRAADVCLKERRPLILCLRETPFNRIHLQNMLRVAEAGATLFPCIPTFYDQPETTADMALALCRRILGHLGLPQPGAYQWQVEPQPPLEP